MSKSAKIAVDACPKRSKAAKPHFMTSLAAFFSEFVPQGRHPLQRKQKNCRPKMSGHRCITTNFHTTISPNTMDTQHETTSKCHSRHAFEYYEFTTGWSTNKKCWHWGKTMQWDECCQIRPSLFKTNLPKQTHAAQGKKQREQYQ